MHALEETIMNYPAYHLSDLDLSTLLSAMVENLHASFKHCMRDHTSRVSRSFSARSRWAPGTTCMPFPTLRVRHLVSCGMQSTSGLSLKSH